MAGSVTAILPAAGRGERLGRDLPKALVPVRGEPMVLIALRRVAEAGVAARAIVAVPRNHLDAFRRVIQAAASLNFPVDAVIGGDDRQASVAQALDAVSDDCEIVVVHDAARPLVSAATISGCVEMARIYGAAMAAVPIRDTVKRVEGDRVRATITRDGLWAAQTPQAFRLGLLRAAHKRAAASRFISTDDAGLVERAGESVQVVRGDPRNIKITEPADLRYAESLLGAGVV